MRQAQKTMFSFLIVTLVIIFHQNFSEAQSKQDLETDLLNSLNATMVDNQTGEKIEITPTLIEEADDYSFRTLSGPYEHAGYKVFFPTDEDMSTDEVSTANLETGTTQTSGVYAEINILYSLRGSDEIRARAVYGEWSSDNGLTDRLVRVANGLAFVERDEFYPTSNSFYYFLDWDFQEYVDFGDFQPLALSQVVVSDGPFSGNTVTLQVNFG